MKLIFLLLLFSCSLFAERIVSLTPPIINSQTICAEIVCARPGRVGFANISIEKMHGKTIVNCYGHGGSGWQTLFGSVEKAISLYQGDKSTPIRVVGAGCVGLATAIELKRKGYTVSGITAKEIYDTPSWNAGGYFGSPHLKNGTPEEQAALDRLSTTTFQTYLLCHQGAHPYLKKESVDRLPIYCSEKTENGIKKLALGGWIAPGEPVILDFQGVKRYGFKEYHSLFLHVTRLMHDMLLELDLLQIPLEVRELSSFCELSESVIFNCTGLGSRELSGDELLAPVIGYLIMFNDGIDHPYLIYHRMEQEGREEDLYFFPKKCHVSSKYPMGIATTGLIGGTYLPFSNEEIYTREMKKMLDRNLLFFYGHTIKKK